MSQLVPSRLLPGMASAWALACLIVGCASPSAETPTEIRGRWTTSAAGFEGRAMAIERQAIEFETGTGRPDRHPVTKVVTSDGPGGLSQVVIAYEGDGGHEYRLTLVHERAEASIRVLNRGEVVWRKDPAR